jgi:hypothetical protein
LFHFLVWAFPYLDIGNALSAYNHIDILTDVFTFISHVRTKTTKILVLNFTNSENTCYSFLIMDIGCQASCTYLDMCLTS